jgi:DNA-binding NtrC family response regulator
LKPYESDAMQASETREDPQATAKNSPAMPAHVLVVEDDALMRWALVETLRDSGSQVADGADCQQAEALVRQAATPFDVVLLDYRLPDSDGLSLIPSIRALSPPSTVIMMTAFAEPEMVRHALELGASRVIHKPFDMGAVSTLVAAARAKQ